MFDVTMPQPAFVAAELKVLFFSVCFIYISIYLYISVFNVLLSVSVCGFSPH